MDFEQTSVDFSTPLTVTSMQPINGDNNVLAEITPAKFDSLVKILLLLDKSSDAITITKSDIMQQYNRGILHASVKEIFDGKEIDLQILNPKKNVKLLKQFKNNTNIYIIDDNENSRYILTNGEIKLFLPKQTENKLSIVQMPDFSDSEMICSAKLDKDTANKIGGLGSDSNYIEYLIQDDKLKGIHIPDTAIYILNEYIQDPKASKLDETTADVSLRTEVYLPVNADEYNISLGKLNDGSYFSYTVCDTGLVKVNVYESLDLTTGGNLLL